MTEAASLIADLDEALADAGETIRLRRSTGTQRIPFDVECRAKELASDSPDARELLQGTSMTQQDYIFVLSPTEINAAQWPGSGVIGANSTDRRIPVRGTDDIIRHNRPLAVQAGKGRYVQDILVRIIVWARG